jgi:hypothetical protein
MDMDIAYMRTVMNISDFLKGIKEAKMVYIFGQQRKKMV